MLIGAVLAQVIPPGILESSGSDGGGGEAPAKASGSIADALVDFFNARLPGLPEWANISLARIILVVATIVVAWLALGAVRYLVMGLGKRVMESRLGAESRGRADTLANLFFSISKYVVYFLAFITALYQANINPTPFLGGAAVVGLAIGFGSQDLVKDVVTGIFILVENQFSMGDYVDLGGKSGVVVGMSVRMVTIKDDQGRLHNLPYRSISVVSNSSRTGAVLVAEIFLADKSDEAAAPGAIERVLEILSAQMKPMIKRFEVVGVINPGTRQSLLRARVNCRPNRVEIVKAELERVVREEFAAEEIEIKKDLVRFYSAPYNAA